MLHSSIDSGHVLTYLAVIKDIKMYKCIIVIFSLLLVWTNAGIIDTCFTPSGKKSECISLFDCSELVFAFKQNPIPKHVTSFLRQSHCGFDATGPKVCCGPLPSEEKQLPITTTTTMRPVTKPPIIEPGDAVDENDSYPEPKCGKDTSGNRIFGGTVTELDEYPWMALLVYLTSTGGFRHECGGALINHRYVLTAAHCLVGPVEEKVGTLYSVRLGEYDTSQEQDCVEDDCADPPQEIRVQRSYAHPAYDFNNKDRTDDIGIIRLLKRATYNDFVKPICLASHKSPACDPGNVAVVAGWGKTLEGRKSAKKLKLGVPFFEKNACARKYQNQFNLQLGDKQICAGGIFGKDSCTGDSGGPLMRILPGDIWESVAVVSFGYGCGRDGWPAVYTSVASYHDWICTKMSETNV